MDSLLYNIDSCFLWAIVLKMFVQMERNLGLMFFLDSKQLSIYCFCITFPLVRMHGFPRRMHILFMFPTPSFDCKQSLLNDKAYFDCYFDNIVCVCVVCTQLAAEFVYN